MARQATIVMRISTTAAYKLRTERGAQLPVDVDYDDDRVKEIAQKQEMFWKQIELLDERLTAIYSEKTRGT